MSFKHYDKNEYGTSISVHECDECGAEFTVCPAVDEDKMDQWPGCLAETCTSYDISRDIDLVWDHIEVERRPASDER